MPRDTYDLLHGDNNLDLEAKNFLLRDLVELELRGLDTLVQSLAGVPGRKTLIWLTGNFPFDLDNPNSYLSPYAYNQYQIVKPHGGTGRDGIAATPTTQAFQVPSTSSVATSDLQVLRPLYEQTMKSLAQAKVAVYPVDTRGVISYYGLADLPSPNYGRALGTISTAAFSDATIHSSMQTFARNTGGKACFGTNDASSCLQQAISDSREYYLLGYYRERGDNKDGWRKLKVEVNRDGVEVLAPDGYFYSAKTPDSKEAQIRDVRSALISPVDFTGLPFTVRLMPAGPTNNGSLRHLRFELTIPPASLSADPSGSNRMNLAIVCVAGAAKGAPVDKLSEIFEGAMMPETMDRVRKDGISYKNVLHLPAGKFTLRFVVHDNLNGKLGSLVVPYSVE